MLHKNFSVVPIDKANDDFFFFCEMPYTYLFINKLDLVEIKLTM